MKKIGLLSDTHGCWDDRFAKYFKDCDEIWHAGDIGTMEVADRLRVVAPLRAVYGNIDGHDFHYTFPQVLRWRCENVEVFMTHIGGYPGKYDARVRRMLLADPPKLFISGHSHLLKVMYDPMLDLLHINPGAAGKAGFHEVRTLVRFVIDGQEIKDLEVIELKDQEKLVVPLI